MYLLPRLFFLEKFKLLFKLHPRKSKFVMLVLKNNLANNFFKCIKVLILLICTLKKNIMTNKFFLWQWHESNFLGPLTNSQK